MEALFAEKSCSLCNKVFRSIPDVFGMAEDPPRDKCGACEREIERSAKRAEERKQHKKKQSRETSKRYIENNPLLCRASNMVSAMKSRSKEKGWEFDSSYFTVYRMMNALVANPHCPSCGVKMNIDHYRGQQGKDTSPSVDRIDTTSGYVRYNVAILCWRCNRIKNDATSSEELFKVARWLRNAEMGKIPGI